ncbi:MAG: phosphate signaling complex protein PhoU [Actinobacteria bacterium]|jgi:phosphate transport system protein|nr:phosphate signaling complex protein PhoU [Actinomycetota bacterium]
MAPSDTHEPLDTIFDELVQMTRLVGSAMNRATQALLDADLALAESVIDADAQIDTLTSDIEERCFDVISFQQPQAADLRVVIGALRIAASLERMGDLAEHVAKQARLRYPRSSIPQELRGTFAEMGGLAEAIVSKTGAVIATRDVSLVADIARHDQAVDRHHRELFTIVLSPSWAHGVEAAIDVTLLSRYYERYADHAVSVTRRVVTVVTGEPYVGVSLT